MSKIPDEVFNKNNPYGYKLNISHPLINPHYKRFMRKCNTPILSDEERFEFERLMIAWLEKKAKEKKTSE